MLDRLSVPRRPFDFEDYVSVLRRNSRWIVGPAFAGIVVSTVIAFMMQDTFESKAMIRIVPQQISPQVVPTVNSQDVAARVEAMAQTILSRGNLTALINTFGLYKDELRREPMEDVLTKMRDDIKITPAVAIGNLQASKNLPAMQVQFSYRDRFLAMKVCSDLVSKLVNASSIEQVESSRSAETFFADDLASAKTALDAADQRLQEYEVRNQGKLPDEMQANLASLSALEQRLNSLTDEQTRGAEQRVMLQTQLQSAKDRLAAVKAAAGSSVVHSREALALDQQIDDLQSQIASLKDRYTDVFPDVQAAKARLAVLQQKRAQMAGDTAAPPAGAPESIAAAHERLDAQAQVDNIQGSINAAKLADSAAAADIANVNAQVHALEARIQESPAGEKEYVELQRDHDVAKARFEKAQLNFQLAKDSVNLNEEKQGETLEIVDPASTPTTPTAPRRSIYIPMGLLAGVILGLILVAIREARDTSLKNLKDARLYTQLTILGSIPLLENDVVVQRRRQVMWVSWATAAILGLAIMAGSMAHYFLSKT